MDPQTDPSTGSPDRRPAPASAPSRRRWRRRLVLLGAVLVGLFLAAESFCRFYLGLGDPPLSMADPRIEYLFKPNQNCRRFGNTIRYNAWSMRSDDFPAR